MQILGNPGPSSKADREEASKTGNVNEGGRPPEQGEPRPRLTTSAAEVSSSSGPQKKTLFQRFAGNFWKEGWDIIKYTSPAILALFLGPLVIQQSFQRERQASRADLSIEYAYLTDARSQSQLAAEIVAKIVGFAVYQEFVMRNYQSDLRLYVAKDGYYSTSRHHALDAAAARYKDHLMSKRDTFSAYLVSLPALPQQELTTLAYRYLDSSWATETRYRASSKSG